MSARGGWKVPSQESPVGISTCRLKYILLAESSLKILLLLTHLSRMKFPTIIVINTISSFLGGFCS